MDGLSLFAIPHLSIKSCACYSPHARNCQSLAEIFKIFHKIKVLVANFFQGLYLPTHVICRNVIFMITHMSRIRPIVYAILA